MLHDIHTFWIGSKLQIPAQHCFYSEVQIDVV